MRYALEEETLMVQTVCNACCEKQEVGELGAFKYCEQDFCLEGT